MGKWFLVGLMILVLCGCGNPARMEHPEDPQGRYHEQIAAAKQLLQQKEDWADRAEWEVSKNGDHWMVTAWRLEHPDRKGAGRYIPWGYSVIELDSRFVAVNYHRKG